MERRRPNRHRDGAALDMEQFRKTHQRLSDRLERLLMQLVILGLVALVLVQTFQVIPSVRRYANLTDALEGISYDEIQPWEGRGLGGFAPTR